MTPVVMVKLDARFKCFHFFQSFRRVLFVFLVAVSDTLGVEVAIVTVESSSLPAPWVPEQQVAPAVFKPTQIIHYLSTSEPFNLNFPTTLVTLPLSARVGISSLFLSSLSCRLVVTTLDYILSFLVTHAGLSTA